MCPDCLSEEKLYTTTTFSVNVDGCTVIVKNVPCRECKTCGEEFFSDEVSEALENIVNERKQLCLTLSVVDWNTEK